MQKTNYGPLIFEGIDCDECNIILHGSTIDITFISQKVLLVAFCLFTNSFIKFSIKKMVYKLTVTIYWYHFNDISNV